MPSFLLIRHALCDPIGRFIAGRSPGVHLNDHGRVQATELARRLSGLPISTIYSSPLERALETAAPLAATLGLPVIPTEDLQEVDFGDWTSKSLQELHGLPAWTRFNSFRSGSRIPGGESMDEVLSRGLRVVEQISTSASESNRLVALVSHGDVLRVLLTYYLGVPLDLLFRLELSPASVSVVQIEEHGPRVLLLNFTADWPQSLERAQTR